jgi:hypothetical protein
MKIKLLSNATTGERIYSAVSPFGVGRFQNFGSGVWIMELKSKRAGIGMDPIIISSGDSRPISIASSGVNIVFEPGPSR